MKNEIEDRFFFQLSEEDVPAPPAESRSAREGRRLALIGCFRPRRCGIATFTADSFDHLRSAAPDLAIDVYAMRGRPGDADDPDVRSEEHTTELQSLMRPSYAVFCLHKNKLQPKQNQTIQDIKRYDPNTHHT